MDDKKTAYLGDGVYAEFDGYYITLDLRDQEVYGVYFKIHLEPVVLSALFKYARSLGWKQEVER